MSSDPLAPVKAAVLEAAPQVLDSTSPDVNWVRVLYPSSPSMVALSSPVAALLVRARCTVAPAGRPGRRAGGGATAGEGARGTVVQAFTGLLARARPPPSGASTRTSEMSKR